MTAEGKEMIDPSGGSGSGSSGSGKAAAKLYEKVSPEQRRRIDDLLALLPGLFDEKGSEHPTTLQHSTELADLYYDTYEFKDASTHYRRVYEGNQRTYGVCSEPVYRACIRLAVSLQQIREFKECEAFYMECLDYYIAAGGEHAPEVLACVEGLAQTHVQTEDYSKAIEFYKRTLSYRQAVCGQDDPATLATVNHLANAYLRADDLNSAHEVCQRSLSYCLDHLGRDHPTTQSSVAILANVRYAQGHKVEVCLSFNQSINQSINPSILNQSSTNLSNSFPAIDQLYSSPGGGHVPDRIRVPESHSWRRPRPDHRHCPAHCRDIRAQGDAGQSRVHV